MTIIAANIGFLIDYYMEWIFLLSAAAAICVLLLVCKRCSRNFEKKAARLEKKYLLDTISQMADLLSEENKRKMREQTTMRKTIVHDCEASESTAGELMACEDVAELFTQKLSVYGKIQTS